MKKFIFAFIIILSVLTVAVSAETLSGEYEGFKWSCADGIVTVTGNGSVPEKLFYNMTCDSCDEQHHEVAPDKVMVTYEKVIFSEGITSISDMSMRLNVNQAALIKEMILPSTLSVLPDYRLYCEKVIISENNPYFSSYNGAMYSKDKTEILFYPVYAAEPHYTVYSGTKTVKSTAFQGIQYLQSVTLPEGLENIEMYAFNGSKKLNKINFPSTLTYIGQGAFLNTKLTEVIVPKGTEKIERETFLAMNSLERMYIPLSVKTLDVNAVSTFGLKHVYYEGAKEDWDKITIKAITSFRYNDFSEAVFHYNSERLPETDEEIEPVALNDKYPSGYLNEDKTTAWYVDENYVLHVHGNGRVDGFSGGGGGGYYKPWTSACEVSYRYSLNGLVVHEGITYIGPYAFDYYHYNTIELPESLITIEDGAFQEVSADKLTFKGTAVIGEYTFPRARISEIVFSDKLQMLKSGCFVGASMVTEFRLPITITQIESNGIPESVTDIYYAGSEKEWKKVNIFEDISNVTMHFGTPSFFTDVAESHWARDYIKALYDKGIINGITRTTFEPEGTLTWGQALKLLLLSCGHGEQAPTDSHWASGYLHYAIWRGQWIHPDEKIDLDAEISRLRFCQIAAGVKMIVAQPDHNPFIDTDDVMVLALYNAGVIGGTSENTFSPDQKLTRAQIAKIIYLLTEK